MTIREDKYGNAVQASRPGLGQVLAAGAGSVVSVPFAAGNQSVNRRLDTGVAITGQPPRTSHVRLVATVPVWVSFTQTTGVAPVAARLATTSMFLPAGLPEYFWVRRGEQIAVTQDATAGSLYITELAND